MSIILLESKKAGLFYQKDKQHGNRTIWYENGNKRLSAQFVDNKMEGNSKGWFPNGQQQFDFNFKNNLEHGICTEWNEEGTKVSEIRFSDGIPVQDLLTGRRILPPEPANKEATIIDTKPISTPAPEPNLESTNFEAVEKKKEVKDSNPSPKAEKIATPPKPQKGKQKSPLKAKARKEGGRTQTC